MKTTCVFTMCVRVYDVLLEIALIKTQYICSNFQPERLTLVNEDIVRAGSDESGQATLSDDDARKLNNCKNVDNHKNSLRLVNNLGTSWTRRNLLMQRLHYYKAGSPASDTRHSSQHQPSKCIQDNDQLVASPWFQEGLSR